MAETLPPDRNKSAGKNRGGKSGKVVDFRYKRPPQQDARANGRAKGNGADRPKPDLADIGAMKPASHGEAYAALDLGTNNCRLLIARPHEHSFRVLDGFTRIVRLGEGLSTTGRLSDAAMERTMEALRLCRNKLREHEPARMRLIATEACRRAVNGPAVLARVEADFMREVALPAEAAHLPKLGFFPGSTIGNMVARTATDLLRTMRATLGEGSRLLIGMDQIGQTLTQQGHPRIPQRRASQLIGIVDATPVIHDHLCCWREVESSLVRRMVQGHG